MSTKRSADDKASLVEGGVGSNSASKRIKTTSTKQKDVVTTSPAADEPADPVKSVLTNPDTLSKALLCLDVQDIPSAARTCKIWNSTLDSVEDELWLGLMRKHHPTLETIRSMLPDDDGADGGNVPCKSWKNLLKRRWTISRSEGGPLPLGLYLRQLGSYFFEVICEPCLCDNNIVAVVGDELATVIESASLVCAGHGEGGMGTEALKLAPIERLEGGAFSVSLRVYEKETGRQSLLLD